MRFPGPPLQAWPACIPGFVSKGRQIHVRYMLKLKESHTLQTSLGRHKTHVSGHPLSKSQVNRNKGQRVLGGAGLVLTLPPGSGHSLHKELQTDRNAIQSHHQDREPGFRGMFVLCPNHDLVHGGGVWISKPGLLLHNAALMLGPSRSSPHKETRTNGYMSGRSFTAGAAFANCAVCIVFTGSEYMGGACSPCASRGATA